MAINRVARGESGQVTAYFVAISIVVFGLMAFAIDIGFFFHARRVAQNAADPGALAGAAFLPGCSLYGNGDDPVTVAQTYVENNLQGKAFSTGDNVLTPEIRSVVPPGGDVGFPSVYTLLERQQKYLLAQFLPGLRGAVVDVPGEAEAVCGPIQEGDVCPLWLEAPNPDADPVYGTDPDPTDNIPPPVISAYGLDAGKVYGMKVNNSSDHHGTLSPPTGNGIDAWRDFMRSGCEEGDETLDVCEGCEVDTQPGDFGNPVLQAFEGGGAGGPNSPGLFKIEKTYSSRYSPNLFPNGHIDCDFRLTLDGAGNVTTVQNYNSSGFPTGVNLTNDEVIDAINQKTDPNEMPSATSAPCAGLRQDGSEVDELTYKSVQGRFMQIVLTDGACSSSCDLPVLGILRMYIVCWTNQQAASGNIPATKLCVPNEPPSQTTIYGVFADYTAPYLQGGGGLGTNPLSPKHVVLVK